MKNEVANGTAAGQYFTQAIQSGTANRHLVILIIVWVLCGICAGLLLGEGSPQDVMRFMLYIGVLSTFASGLYLTLAFAPKETSPKRDDEKPTKTGMPEPPKSNFGQIYLEDATSISSNGSSGWFA